MMKLRFFAVAVLAVVVLTACGGLTGVVPQPTSTPPLAADQLLVFASPDGSIYTVTHGGSEHQRLLGTGAGTLVRFTSTVGAQVSSLARYFWPTWSPTGERLAVSRTPGAEARDPAALVVVPGKDEEETLLHSTAPGFPERVAEGAPHYSHWSPDGQRLAFIGPSLEGSSLDLFVVSPYDLESLLVVARGAPLYFGWSPDSSRLVIHQRNRLLVYDVDDRETRDLGRSDLTYRVPGFSPDGGRVAYVKQLNGEPTLVLRNLDSGEEISVVAGQGGIAFLWSPQGDSLAVAIRSSPRSVFYDEVWTYSVEGGGQRRLVQGLVMAFFWSPSGDQLAVIRTTGDVLPLEWVVARAGVDDTRVLDRFIPSRDWLIMLAFFDQYAWSHSPWSADGTHLVYAGTTVIGVDDRGFPSPSQVFVVEVSEESPPRSIGEGILAFWVPGLSE
jgi:hypothetical protein